MSDPKKTKTPTAFLKSVKATALGPVLTFAHGGTTYRVGSRELAERALFDLYTQTSEGKPWSVGGKTLPPYNPVHEPTEEFRAALAAHLK